MLNRPDGDRSFQPRLSDPQAAAQLSKELGVHPVTAQVLAGRGFEQVDRARRFLRPSLDDLHDPALLRDLEPALDILEGATRAGERIAVYGDYDVDGVCGTTVFVRTLELLGANVRAYIPHRVTDGYGLNGAALERLREEGCHVVVTVDNGTSRVDEIARAQENGMRIVVTDHHEAGHTMPPCPVINPKRPDTTYPFPALAGCGVALKVALALVERMGRLRQESFRRMLPELLAVTAIGTVADVVPLRDENRSLVTAGLAALSKTTHEGLRALLEVSRCSERAVTTRDVAFRLGPRINAAGRLASAELALNLLLCEDAERARQLAAELDAGNRERQRIEREQAEEAFAQAEERLQGQGDGAPALVLSHVGWHPGVIGIVAARVAETYHLPAALVTIENDSARGSARCFGGLPLHEALERCAPHLLTYGGHAAAAGFTLEPERVDAFREAFVAACAELASDAGVPRLVDAELPLDAINEPLAAEIETLQPFGAGNEEPLFCAFGVRAAGLPRRRGHEEQHLAFYAATDRSSVRAVAFNQAADEPLLEGRFDLAFIVRRRREGPERLEIHVREIVASSSSKQ